MKPNYDLAATKAMEILVDNKICSAPIAPLPIIKKQNGVLVLSFSEMSDRIGIDRSNLVSMFGLHNQDAVTTANINNGKIRYAVAYNQKLPLAIVQRALARELGHIVLGHDGSRPEEVRNAEAICFANHLLAPRPLIKMVQDSGLPITVELFGNMTGCYEHCLGCIMNLPGTNVPEELNRQIRDQFADYANNFLNFQKILSIKDKSRLVDFGTYMDNYKE